VLDLGRPERLIVAMTHYNFKSIFAWNISSTPDSSPSWLHICGDAGAAHERLQQAARLLAFLWRLILTTGTGSIFGFLVAREAYDSALYAPLFIIMSFAFGLAIFILVLMAACGGTRVRWAMRLWCG